MKLLILIGSISSIFSLNAQTVYIDDAPLPTIVYGVKMQTNSLRANGDTIYFKIQDEQYKDRSFYAIKNSTTVKDSFVYTPYLSDSALHTTIWLLNDSTYQSMRTDVKHAFGEWRISTSCLTVKDQPKTEIKNFNVNRIMTSNEISFDFIPTVTAYYPWSITNSSGREVASGSIYAHTPSESFKITADNLKAGRYTLTIGEGSDSRSENFSIY